jgi:hypothetical protein
MQGQIQTRLDEQLATSQSERQTDPNIDEYAPPDMPDPEVR